MPSSWSPFVRRSVVGGLILGIALVAWLIRPEDGPSGSSSSAPSSSDDRARAVYLVYPTDDPDTTSRYRARAEAWAALSEGGDRTFRVRADTQLHRDSLLAGEGVIAGTPSSPLVASVLTERGISVRDDGAFVLGGRSYADPRDVLVLEPVADGPARAGRALHLAVGRTDSAALDYAYASPFLFSDLRADYKLLRDGRLLAYGTRPDTTARSRGACTVPPAPARHVDLRPTATPIVETEHFRFFAHGTLGRAAIQSFVDRRTSAARSLWVAGELRPPTEKIDYHLFRTQAGVRVFGASIPPVGTDRRQWLRSLWRWERSAPTMDVRLDSTSGALVAMVPDDPGPVLPTEARRWMGASADSSPGGWGEVIDVGRVALAQGTWYGRPVEGWTARLHAADAVPSLRALAHDTTLVHESPYAQPPVAATMVSFLEARDGAEVLRRNAPPREVLRRLEPAWQRYLDSLVVEHTPSSSSASLPTDLYGANVAFATGPAWGSPRGYASRVGDAALAALRDLGATAAAIVPYTAMPAPDAPVSLLRRRHPGRSQSDATVAHALRRADALGMDVMLKPQISGEVEWPGAIEMPSAEAWDRFFAEYTDWMLHYALMAEIHDVEVLAVGTELVAATRGHEAEWRRLVERVRAVYDGAVVYAANWGEEAERLAFADALDAVGIDSYYPLTDDTSATDAELRAGAERVAQRIQDVAERTGTPVLLTEMGFPNTRGAWAHPHEKREDKPERPADQARATRALTAALSDVPIRGAFWWRWSPICRFDYGRFPPTAPTRTVLRAWFEHASAGEIF